MAFWKLRSLGKKVLHVIKEKAFSISSITNHYLSYLTIVLTFYASNPCKEIVAQIVCWLPHSKIEVHECQQ
jgi:hypothetical protein